jgi:hypothetical protein
MKIVKLEDGEFRNIEGYAPLNGEQIKRTLTPKMAIQRAQRALKNSRKFSNGEPIWVYDRPTGTIKLVNPKSPCFSLSLNETAMGSPMTIADGEVFQFETSN